MIEWLRDFLPETRAGFFWLALGTVGQLLFASRWLVQLVASERSGRSTVPQAFWWLSILGGALVLAYGLHDRDPVVVIGQWGVLVYLRNLVLLRRERRPVAG
jgi:lipid-A-disaccharide synthase-like uncharacterized protein